MMNNIDVVDDVTRTQQQYREAVILSYVYFIGSIISIVLLLSAFLIFSYFR